MDTWMPVESDSNVSFWKPSSKSEEGSIWIPSSNSESEGSFWKPSVVAGASICKPSRFWKGELEGGGGGGGGVSGWKPSSESSSSSSESNESEEHQPNLEYKLLYTWCNWYSDEPIETVIRRFRRDVAKQIRKEYKFQHGKKTLIWSNGIYPRPDKCYDFVWVAVHGTDSICLVTKNKNVDMKRVGPYYQRHYTNEQTFLSLTKALISEIECLPYDDEEFRGKGLKKPFGVVSVISGTKNVKGVRGYEYDDSSVEYDEKKAVAYLKERMESGSEFTLKKTIRRAISAFQLLFGQEFFAEDIWVTVLEGKGPVKHLSLTNKMLHLAVIGGYPFLTRSAIIPPHRPPMMWR